jgi:hypothetical protein
MVHPIAVMLRRDADSTSGDRKGARQRFLAVAARDLLRNRHWRIGGVCRYNRGVTSRAG